MSHKGTALVLLAAVATFAAASEPTVVRIKTAFGDTIRRAQRDSFHLFPNSVNFRYAVILGLPGSQVYAKVAQADGDTLVPVYYRILPGQLERIRFLIDYRDFVAEQQKTDTTVAPSLRAFWREVESRPLRDEPSGNAESGAEDSPTTPSLMTENRYHMTMAGATAGSALGGCIGSWAGIKKGVGQGSAANCLDQNITVPVYSVNHPIFWTTACCLTAVGTTAGYIAGDKLDRTRPPALPLPEEGKEWRTSCAIGAVIPALAAGAGFFLLAGPLHYGRTGPLNDMPDDGSVLTMLPMALTGMCIAVEVTTIGYYIGRIIDRQNAEKIAATRQTLSR
ncbi:hypothetical protein FJY68_04470 [candidate division WOR-3 bacterium]|uniref:DUF3592 domain-containing protein n=1 Tax=candidate division WOR-3 bacterium TaxID=2052148 RepID=A0A938BT00_UNCW3|nr:hypothetical protein [candidate division WOR-3 bacterium]